MPTLCSTILSSWVFGLTRSNQTELSGTSSFDTMGTRSSEVSRGTYTQSITPPRAVCPTAQSGCSNPATARCAPRLLIAALADNLYEFQRHGSELRLTA